MSLIKTPHAAVIIWNYRDRFSSKPLQQIPPLAPSDPHAVDVVRLDKSIISIDIQKQKAVASGSFSIVLAPTKNWLALLTPGSWLAILMTQTPFTKDDLYIKANAKQVKMLGRIESVRASVSVNAAGARTTVYTVTGVDWGSVFDTTLYIDPIVRAAEENNLSFALRYVYGQYAVASGVEVLFSSDQNLDLLLMMWGLSQDTAVTSDIPNGIKIQANAVFRFPDLLVRFFNFKPSPKFSSLLTVTPTFKEEMAKVEAKSTSNDVSRLVTPYTGVVRRNTSLPIDGVFFDQYDTVKEGWCALSPDSILGQHQMWQILNDSCNPVLNELICDIRWESNGQPSLAIYKRIRPFLVRDIADVTATSDTRLSDIARRTKMESLSARFFDLRTVQIPLKEILSVEAGNNWRDKYNFVEILYDHQLNEATLNSVMKLNSQSFDTIAFSREGFRPKMETCRYWPEDITADAPALASQVAANSFAAVKLRQAKEKNEQILKDAIQADLKVKKTLATLVGIQAQIKTLESAFKTASSETMYSVNAKLKAARAQEIKAKKDYNDAVVRAQKTKSARNILEAAKKKEEKEKTAKKVSPAAPTTDSGINAAQDAKVAAQRAASDNSALVINTLIWKTLLREWYFNTHLMLNGTINFVGQDNYIQVGDNIMFPLRVFNFQGNLTQAALKNKQPLSLEQNSNELAGNADEPWILAHVENIAHRVSMTDSAARSYTSSIHFIRGVIVDKDRKPLSITAFDAGNTTTGGLLDRTTTDIPRDQFLNKENIISSIAQQSDSPLNGEDDK